MALRGDYKQVKGYVSISVCVYMYVNFTFLLPKFLYLNFDKNHMGFQKKREREKLFEWFPGGLVAFTSYF